MPNTYFRFKQFTVQQEHCAMKVCTDACLFGAWVARRIPAISTPINRILDVGAGTGLLSLMLAQQHTAAIDAVELDPAAALQAAGNFEASPWGARLKLLQGDARTIDTGHRYELVVSNPPFFGNDLKSPHGKRNLALHSSELSLVELCDTVRRDLASTGRFAVLLPWHRKAEMLSLAASHGWHTEASARVKQTPAHDPFRVMVLLGSEGVKEEKEEEIVIRENDLYTRAFTALLEPYYLRL